MSATVPLLAAPENRVRPTRSRAQPRLVIDARMLFASGIGRYLREVLQRMPETDRPATRLICNTREQRDWVATHLPEVAMEDSVAGIYSLREQFLAWRVPTGATLWVPHYNVPRLGRVRLVATVHDVAPLALPEIFGGAARQLAVRFYFQTVRRRASHVIAVSRFTRDELQRIAGVPAARTTVIHNGVGELWFDASLTSERNGHVLYVGNLKPHKNLARLVEAMERVRQTRAVGLDIVGKVEGFRTGLAASLVERLRALPWIRWHGEISDLALRQLYQSAAALVFPSLYEGFGLPLLEAMGAGCPVVASRAASLPEIGGRPRTAGGFVDYFDPQEPAAMADAILGRLAVPEVESLRLRTAARNHAAGFAWDRTAQETWRLLAAQGEAAARSAPHAP